MTDARSWKDEARRLINSGMSVKAASAAVGKHESTIRVALDINGAKERRASWRTRNRVESKANEKLRERHAIGSYGADPIKRPLTLPRISLLAQTDEDQRAIRFAPRTRVSSSSDGAERWRQVHRAMIRAGKLPEPGLPEQLHH